MRIRSDRVRHRFQHLTTSIDSERGRSANGNTVSEHHLMKTKQEEDHNLNRTYGNDTTLHERNVPLLVGGGRSEPLDATISYSTRKRLRSSSLRPPVPPSVSLKSGPGIRR